MGGEARGGKKETHDDLMDPIGRSDRLSGLLFGEKLLFSQLNGLVRSVGFAHDIQSFQTVLMFLLRHSTCERDKTNECLCLDLVVFVSSRKKPLALRLISCSERCRPVLNALFCCFNAPGRWTLFFVELGDIPTKRISKQKNRWIDEDESEDSFYSYHQDKC